MPAVFRIHSTMPSNAHLPCSLIFSTIRRKRLSRLRWRLCCLWACQIANNPQPGALNASFQKPIGTLQGMLKARGFETPTCVNLQYYGCLRRGVAFKVLPKVRSFMLRSCSSGHLSLSLAHLPLSTYVCIFIYAHGCICRHPRVIFFVVCMHPASHLQAVLSGLRDEKQRVVFVSLLQDSC